MSGASDIGIALLLRVMSSLETRGYGCRVGLTRDVDPGPNPWIKASSPRQDFLLDLTPTTFAPLHFFGSGQSAMLSADDTATCPPLTHLRITCDSLRTSLSILSSDNPARLRIARTVRINLNSHTSNFRLPRSRLPTALKLTSQPSPTSCYVHTFQ
jgi:hypothetical protein